MMRHVAWFVFFAATLAFSETRGGDVYDPRQGLSAPKESQPNTITVLAYRPEVEREDRPGKSLVIRPEDPTRFDTKTQLAREASLALPDTGRITAQGFAVPRIRGQDTRLTEVYVEDLLLQDPYSGLPLVDEIDLRAFGELAVYQGVSPVSLPTLNSIGVVQYRVRPSTRGPSVGVTTGKPYGVSTWAMTHDHVGKDEGQETDLKIYARRHVTDGRYDYYSDNGTPYNTADDSQATRQNNHRSSTQFMLYGHSQVAADSKLKILLLSQESRNGLPALNANLESLAEQTAQSRLVNLHWEKALGSGRSQAPGQAIIFKAGGHDDQRTTHDEGHSMLSAKDESGFRSTSGNVGLAYDFVPFPAFTRVSLDHESARARVTSGDTTAVKVQRTSDKFALGSTAQFFHALTIEAKALALALHDQLSDTHRITKTQGASLAAELRRPAFSVYAQAGQNRRAPSLLEEFGDGGVVLAAEGIEPEKAVHFEIGVTANPVGDVLQMGVTVFQDETRDRITLIPALAGTLRAQNIGHTRVRGVEANADVTLAATRLYGGYSLLQPLDLTSELEPRRLPFVAERTATAGVEQKVGSITLREGSRYQGRVYRDLTNSIVVPAYVVHDLSADTTVAIAATQKLALGLALLNATNVQKLEISSPGTAENDGATSYSDVTGYALPGRQWRLMASITF